MVLHTGVNIVLGENFSLDFTMEETVLTIGEEVIVMGKKPLFDVDETSLTKPFQFSETPHLKRKDGSHTNW